MRAPAADTQTITVTLPPWLAWQAAQELQRAGLPFQQAPDGTITTLEAGAAILDMVQQRSQAQRPQARRTGGWDLLSRRPENRSRLTDALGFAVSLAVVYGVISQSAVIPNPNARAIAILVGGILITLLISEIVIGKSDPRRWLFVFGMFCMFGAGAIYAILHGMGVL